MKFLKKLGKSLFGSSRSSTPKKGKAKAKKSAKPTKKKSTKKTIRKTKPKTAKKKVAKGKKQPGMVKKAIAALPMAEVTHYFPHVNAAVLKIKGGNIRLGDELHFKGHTTDFKQRVVSMQIDHKPVTLVKKGDDFGIEVKSRVRAGDLVYKK